MLPLLQKNYFEPILAYFFAFLSACSLPPGNIDEKGENLLSDIDLCPSPPWNIQFILDHLKTLKIVFYSPLDIFDTFP